MRSPLTAVVFALELTHDVNMLLPLLVGATFAHGFTVLALRRSILTEKIARRGYHVSREYAVDPLEILFVREVMRTNITALSKSGLRGLGPVRADAARRRQRLYPVIDDAQKLIGVVRGDDLQRVLDGSARDPLPDRLDALMQKRPVVAYADENLRAIVYRMAEKGLTRFPVVDRENGRLLGMIALSDLLKARAQNLDAEQRRERVLGTRIAFPVGAKPRKAKSA
jgi:CBS domain-containing protein